MSDNKLVLMIPMTVCNGQVKNTFLKNLRMS